MRSLILWAFVISPVWSQTLTTRFIDVDGLNRQYLLYLPIDFSVDENLPVMLWYHGGGDTAEEAMNFEADFRSLANSERFIAVYMQAYPDVLEGCTCWGYEGGGYSNGNYEIDLAYTSAVIDDLVGSYNADRNRVYAGGFSMGGNFVWDLACAKSDEIAAVAPVAASVYQWTFETCDSAEPIGVVHILGTNDWYTPYDGGWVPSAEQQYDYWVAKNDAETPPEVTNLGGGVTRFTWYARCTTNHGYQHFRRQGGGHDVPSFATNAIWEYVSDYTIDGVLSNKCGDVPRPPAPPPLTPLPNADVNGDGNVDICDIVRLAQLVLDPSSPIQDGADINQDGTVDSEDIGAVLDRILSD